MLIIILHQKLFINNFKFQDNCMTFLDIQNKTIGVEDDIKEVVNEMLK